METLKFKFEDILQARQAIKELKNSGFNPHLDAGDSFLDEHAMEITFDNKIGSSSLTSLVLKKNNNMYNTGKGPLTAASPMVSGMAGFNEPYGNVAVIVNIDNEKVNEINDLVERIKRSY